MSETKEFQTRTEYGRIDRWSSLKEAIAFYDRLEGYRNNQGGPGYTDTVYKISFGDAFHRFVPKRRPLKVGEFEKHSWNPVSEARISELCPEYARAVPLVDVFWVDQSLSHDFIKTDEDWTLYKEISRNEENVQMALQIRCVLPDATFRSLAGLSSEETEKILRSSETREFSDRVKHLRRLAH